MLTIPTKHGNCLGIAGNQDFRLAERYRAYARYHYCKGITIMYTVIYNDKTQHGTIKIATIQDSIMQGHYKGMYINVVEGIENARYILNLLRMPWIPPCYPVNPDGLEV